MSAKHPIIAITGSSGAGTTSVSKTFEQIFYRESVKAAYVEGDAFHRYDREQMKVRMAEELARGNHHFSHFGPEANLFAELEQLFRDYAASGGGRTIAPRFRPSPSKICALNRTGRTRLPTAPKPSRTARDRGPG